MVASTLPVCDTLPRSAKSKLSFGSNAYAECGGVDSRGVRRVRDGGLTDVNGGLVDE